MYPKVDMEVDFFFVEGLTFKSALVETFGSRRSDFRLAKVRLSGGRLLRRIQLPSADAGWGARPCCVAAGASGRDGARIHGDFHRACDDEHFPTRHALQLYPTRLWSPIAASAAIATMPCHTHAR